MTKGGPIASANWTRNNNIISSNETFKKDFVVENYTTAVYNHTLSVFDDAPGVYKFSANNPFAIFGALSASHVVEGKIMEVKINKKSSQFPQHFLVTIVVILLPLVMMDISSMMYWSVLVSF